MNQDVLSMREHEVIALRASHQGKFDHAKFAAEQAKLRAAFEAQPKKIRIDNLRRPVTNQDGDALELSADTIRAMRPMREIDPAFVARFEREKAKRGKSV